MNLTKEEKAVYDCIREADGRITQLQLARKVYVGCHDKFEGYDNPKQSSLRKIRQIVRDLRLNHKLQILSDGDGYFLKRTQEEAILYMDILEKKAKAASKSHMVTYREMSKILGVTSDYFERQIKIQFE